MLEKIKKGEKTIESRWYTRKFEPWDNIKIGETIYFKETGHEVSLKTKVSAVVQIDSLGPAIVKQILVDNHMQLGINKKDIKLYYERFKSKQYCILIYLKEPQSIKPFKLNKQGLGYMSAWICFKSLKDIKVRQLTEMNLTKIA